MPIMDEKVNAMRKMFVFVFLILFAGILVSCGSDTEVDEEAKAERKTNAEAEGTSMLSDDEAKELTIETLQHIEDNMSDLSEMDQTKEWYEVDWSDPESNQEVYDKGLAKTKDVLQPYIDDAILEELSIFYVTYYFNILEGMPNNSGDVGVRFEVIDQQEDFFNVSYLILEDVAKYLNPGTFEMRFLKDDGTWKLEEQSFISAEEQPLHVTIEDIKEDAALYQEDGEDAEVNKIDEVTVEGATYIVYEVDDYISARNVETSEINHELAEKYMESDGAPLEGEMNANNEENDKVNEEDDLADDAEATFYSNYEDYETESMHETNELVGISASYPKLGIDNIDHELVQMADDVYADFLSQKQEMEEIAEAYDMQLSRELSFSDIILTDDYASIMFQHYAYDGGAHGNYTSLPFNYSFKDEKMIGIKDVLGGSQERLETLSQKVRAYLEERNDVFEGAVAEVSGPQWDNFSTFFLTEDSIIIMYQRYEVAPYASGIVSIEVPFSEL